MEEAGNSRGTKKPHKISVRRKHLNQRRIKAEPISEKLFENCGDAKQEFIANSKEGKFEDISRECDEMAKSDATSSRIEKVDAGSTALVDKPTPLATDPNALLGEEDIHEPVIQTEQQPTKRRTSSVNPVQASRICEQESYAQLEANIKKLQKENSMSCHNMQAISESCAQLRRENRHLLKELKKVCPPDTIAYLEAKNPDKKVDNRGSTQ